VVVRALNGLLTVSGIGAVIAVVEVRKFDTVMRNVLD